MKAHQYFDSAFPVWKKGDQVQLYFANILPPGEFEGTRFNSPKKRIAVDEEEEYEEEGEIIRIGKGQLFFGLHQLFTSQRLLLSSGDSLYPDHQAWSPGYKAFFMLNSTEHKISTAHKN